MILIPAPNPKYIYKVGSLSQKTLPNSTYLQVFDSEIIPENNKILIGKPYQSQTVKHVSKQKDKDKIYINPATVFSYPSDTEISVYKWDFYIAEISFDDFARQDSQKVWLPLEAGTIPYTSEYIYISKTPYVLSETTNGAIPQIRYKYYNTKDGEAHDKEETEWFYTNASPYTNTILGEVHNNNTTVLSLVNKCKVLYGDRGSVNISIDVWLMWFNEALKQLHRLLANFKHYYQNTYIFYLSKDTIHYFLPFHSSYVTAVWRTYKTVNEQKLIPLRNVNVLSIENLRQQHETNNYVYSLSENFISFDPVPKEPLEIYVTYSRISEKFSYESLSSEVIEDFEDIFVYYALYKQYLIDGDPKTNLMKREFDNQIAELVKSLNVNPVKKSYSRNNPLPLSNKADNIYGWK